MIQGIKSHLEKLPENISVKILSEYRFSFKAFFHFSIHFPNQGKA